MLRLLQEGTGFSRIRPGLLVKREFSNLDDVTVLQSATERQLDGGGSQSGCAAFCLRPGACPAPQLELTHTDLYVKGGFGFVGVCGP